MNYIPFIIPDCVPFASFLQWKRERSASLCQKKKKEKRKDSVAFAPILAPLHPYSGRTRHPFIEFRMVQHLANYLVLLHFFSFFNPFLRFVQLCVIYVFFCEGVIYRIALKIVLILCI